MSRPVRIAMLDSGVTEGHPHLPSVAGGIQIAAEGDLPGYRDMLGHGTAVAALVHWLTPEAELFSVKIFDRRLATTLPIVLRGMEWCVANGMDIINLSLGTSNPEHRPYFAAAIERVQASGAVLVSAYEVDGSARMLPGSMSAVIGVSGDAAMEHGEVRAEREPSPHLVACPYPREIEGVPRERNLNGVSFAVAHVSAMIAQRWHQNAPEVDWMELLAGEHGASPASGGTEMAATSPGGPGPDPAV